MKLGIKILPRPEVLDSQGRTVLNSLKESGFKLNECKVGKYVVIETAHSDLNIAKKEIQKMADYVLYNPLIETYEVEEL